MIFGLIYIFIFLILDQLSKHLAKAFITGDTVWIKGLLELGYRENYGASFGSFSNQYFLFFMVTLFALGLFGYMFTSVNFKTKKAYSWAIVLFIAGTLGNAIDRALLTYVIDFLHYPFLNFIIGASNNFYNNFADLYLSLAIVLFAIDIFFLENKRKKVSQDEDRTKDS